MKLLAYFEPIVHSAILLNAYGVCKALAIKCFLFSSTRSAKEAELNERRAKDRGEELPKEARFDSNCITPGTRY